MALQTFQDRLSGLRRKSNLLGAAVLAIGLAGAFHEPRQFFQSYLVALTFWFGMPLGALGVLMLHHLVGGAWGHATRRLLEAATRTLPAMFLLWFPLISGMHWLYSWSRPETVLADPVVARKILYLNGPGFIGRAALYFMIWWTLTYALNRRSADQDRTGDPKLIDQLMSLSAGGLVIFAFTVTFASFDWLMSLEPRWFSSIFGAVVAMGWMLGAHAFTIVTADTFAKEPELDEALDQQVSNDLGNLMLAFLMLWTYMAFSQFLLIWCGNLPEEIEWYLTRFHGGWLWISLSLPLVHFGLPFLMLLSRPLKRNRSRLVRVALVVLFMRLVDHFWLVAPVFSPGVFHLHWMDLLTPVGVGGLWLAAFFSQLGRLPLVPLHDVETPEGQEEVTAHG